LQRFKKVSSRKKISPYWKGTYKCIEKNCDMKLYAKCDEFKCGQVVKISIQYSTTLNVHMKIEKVEPLTGNERSHLLSLIQMFGLRNAYNQFINDHKPVSNNVMYQVKHQFEHRNTLVKPNSFDKESSILSDIKSCFNIFKIEDSSNSKIKGFVQKLVQIPFGYMFMSNYQVIFIML
jgi:hypothetical protein